ncbi:odorant receptor 43a-like [Temnothorax curvispinosus]|uniref:Odorant receptor 43a-like n=1 Tax=Temnothorax curvispinosus TaxID=300111 RepID=A0A6J1QRA0_9HYME|nr:odorant receptor 43a-like [Temnothorax curvispinosus]
MTDIKVDFEWAVKLNRFTLNLIGLWPKVAQNPRQKLMCNFRVLVTLLGIISLLIPSIHSLIKIFGNSLLMLDNLQITLPAISCMIRIMIFWWKKEVSMRYLTNITDPGKVLPLQTYYIYNVSNSPFYETTFILQGFSLMITSSVYTGTDSFMGYLVFHICGQLENFRTRILNLDKFSHFEEALSSSVQDHIRLIRCIKIIDNTFNLMLLSLLVYFGILFALFGFLFITITTQGRNLSIARLIYILTAFITGFTHMCLYCVIGEFLVIQCDGIYEATYHYKWYNLKPRQTRNLLIIMMLANKPLHLTAGKLFPMTMATFCNLLKTSGGYISVLLAHRN